MATTKACWFPQQREKQHGEDGDGEISSSRAVPRHTACDEIVSCDGLASRSLRVFRRRLFFGGSISITEEKRRRKNREREREKLGLYSAVPWECVREWCGAPLIRQDQFTCFYNLWANTFNLFPQTIKWNREKQLHVHPRCHSILNGFDSCRRRFQGALNNFVPVMDKYGERPSRRTAGRRLMKDASSKLFSSVFSFPHPRAKSMKINPNSKKQSRCWDPARGTQLDKTV